MHNLKLLFLLKKNLTSGGEYAQEGKRSGLYNSAHLLAEELREEFKLKTRVEIVVDGNSIDRELAHYKPDLCIIEAIWVTPEKIKELLRLHRSVVFVIRVHSEIPFLSQEGVAINWIKEYCKLPRTVVAFNSVDTYESFKATKLFKRTTYLPNVYDDVVVKDLSRRKYLKELATYLIGGKKIKSLGSEINVGCFGAIRPVKNQLIQAFAAIEFANKYNVTLNFHINGTRTEQGGESILKNIRALFENSPHRLVEHPWLNRRNFLDLVSLMDVGVQASFNESFNIVAADFVSKGVPVLVSPAIKWMPDALKADPVDASSIVNKLEDCFMYPYLFKYMQYFALHRFNKQALKEWKYFLK